ncbi:MAG: Ig domain protein group 2 domain protein, partial [Capsulimonas sp.]|nr:Ig domain protein group 2 domain protein [Capsulimonas sp.]
LNDKIAYAKTRWGCTLFYVDSNVHFDLGTNPSDEKDYELLPAHLFQEAAAANPDVLLIPEQQITRYYAYGAPYDELKQGTAATPTAIRRIYPDSFTVISVATDTSGGPLDTRRAELIDSVRHGDILLFRAWYETPEMKPVQEIYKATGR